MSKEMVMSNRRCIVPGGPTAVPSKITRPLCDDIFPRIRLFKLLDSLREKAALWITGPPGSGKTALVSSYIEQAGITCIWYQIDPEDNDPSTFFYYLTKGAEQSAGRKLPVPPFTAEYYENPLSFSRWYFEQLCAQLKTPVVLVLDNYQELPADSVIHTILGFIVDELPIGMQLIVISRDDLPDFFVRLQLSGRIGTVSWLDLQLTLEESDGILGMRGRVPAKRIPYLHEKAAGWVAGLLLLEAGTGLGKTVEIDLPDEAKETIFQYFAAEILNRQDNEIKDFLVRTSFLPHMTIKMAGELSGLKNAARILYTLNRRNYFVSRRPGLKSTYQYHPLFREFLLEQAKQHLSPSQRRQILKEAATLLQKSGETEEAAALYIQGKYWNHLVALILKNAAGLCAEGRIRPLIDWIEKLPEEICAHSPWLLYWLGTCRIFLNPVNSTPLLEKAYNLFSQQHDISGMLLAWASIINSILFRSGSFSPFQQWIDEFTGLEQYLDDQPLQIKAPVIVSMLYALGLASTDTQLFDKWAEKGNYLLQQDIDVVNKAHTFNLLIVKTTFRGDLAGADYYLMLFRSFDTSNQLPPFSRIQLKNCAAALAWLSGRFNECEQEGHEGLRIADTSGVHLYNHYFWGQLAAGALSTGNMDTAEKYLQEMAGCKDRMRPWEQSFFHVLATWSALVTHNSAQAMLHARQGIKLIAIMGTTVNNALIYLAMALAFNLAENHDEAENYLQLSLKTGKQSGDRQTEFSSLLAGAWFSLQRGNHRAADDYLQQAMTIGREKGYVNGYFWNNGMMEHLCHRALEVRIEEKYVQELIRTRNIMPPPRMMILENWPWKIKVYTLGRFSLLINNQLVTFSRKARARPLELLYALIASGGRNVSKEKITAYLWPEALGDAANSSFSTTLQRLRKLLTIPEAILVRHETITLNPRLFWIDIWAFERFISTASTLSTDQIEEKFILLKKASSLYHGSFLQEQENPYWLYTMREGLQKKFSRISLQIADRFIQKLDYQQALDFLDKATKMDPDNSRLYQSLLDYYGEIGIVKKAGSSFKNELN